MADINSLSFGCGNTLLATQLNIMVDAIRSLITLVGTIGDKVGSYIPLSGSEEITGVLAPDTDEGHNLGKSTKRWGTVWASTGGFKTIDFYNLQTPFGKLGELYVGKDTSNNNEAILQFKHGNNNEEIIATRDWVNSLTRINIGSTGSISEELYNNESNYIKIESSSDNPIVIAGYDDNSVPIGIKFGDASTGDVLTVHGGKIYINGDIFSGDNGVSVLNDLSDVKASAPHNGEFLMYNGKNWVSNPLPESLIIHPSDVSNNEEYYLKYEVDDEHPSGWYSWVERPAGAKELNELNDVEINDIKLKLGQVLVYSQVTDGDNNTYNSWVNKTVSGVLTYNQSDRNKYLKVNSDGDGTEWSDISLSDLSNTEIGGSNNALSNGLVLVYDSSLSKWKNTSLPANLPSVSGHSNQYLKVNNDGTLAEWTNVAPGGNNGNIDNDTKYTLTLNGSAKGTSGGTNLGSFYAPTESGNSGLFLKSNGNNSAPTWVTPSLSIAAAETNDSSTITLAASTKYKLTAAGNTCIFTTPPAGSGLTGIKYQTTGNNATTITPSSGYVTLKAGNNVSFNNSSTGILEISASVTNDGGTGNGDITGVTVDGLGLLARKMTDDNTDKNYTYNHHVTVPSGNVQVKIDNSEILNKNSLLSLVSTLLEALSSILTSDYGLFTSAGYNSTLNKFVFSLPKKIPQGTTLTNGYYYYDNYLSYGNIIFCVESSKIYVCVTNSYNNAAIYASNGVDLGVIISNPATVANDISLILLQDHNTSATYQSTRIIPNGTQIIGFIKD